MREVNVDCSGGSGGGGVDGDVVGNGYKSVEEEKYVEDEMNENS